MSSLFDAYSFRARLQPALLVFFPSAVSVALLAPEPYRVVTSIAAIAAYSGVTLFIASVARRWGRSTERRLYALWGGKPTTIMLRHRDDALDSSTKARRHAALSAREAGWTAPSPEEERADPSAADEKYDGAVTWLLEQTRDARRFPLVIKENIAYGFARNLRGLRPLGLIAAAATLAAVITVAAPYYWGSVPWTIWAAGGVAATAITAWAFLVNDRAVRDAAEGYARALLGAIDNLGAAERIVSEAGGAPAASPV